jgi:hypothetical protein
MPILARLSRTAFALLSLLLPAVASAQIPNPGSIANPRPLSSSTVVTALGYVPAHSGANADITSLGGLTTPLTFAQLAPLGDKTILSNITGSTAPAAANTLTALLDNILGSTQGSVIFRGASSWGVLTPAINGQFLQTQGAGADVRWASATGAGTVNAGTAGQLASYAANGTVVSGTTALPTGTTATTVAAIDNSTKLATTAQAWSALPYASGYVNVLRDTTMVAWTKGISGTIAPAATGAAAIAASGWAILPTGASVTWAQDLTGQNGAPQSLKITGATSVTDVVLGQRIESVDAARLAGQTVTFQIALFNGTGASITPQLATRVAGAADNWTGPVADLAATNLQPCAASTWCIESYAFAVSANAGFGYEVKVDLGNNFSTNAKFVRVTAADLRVTPGAATGLVSSPPAPELRDIEAQLRRSARYYQTSYVNGTAPGAATRAGMVGGSIYVSGTVISTALVTFLVEMRATPSFSYWDGAGGAGNVTFLVAAGNALNDGGAYSSAPGNVNARGFTMGFGATNGTYYTQYAAYADFW